MTNLKNWAASLLAKAGIDIDGNNPWDIRIHNEKFLERIATEGTLGLGESYMDGWWDCDSLDQFFDRVLMANLAKEIRLRDLPLFDLVKAKILNPQTKAKSIDVAEIHYNLGNDFYEAMLDKNMQYTCAYYSSGAKNLEEAQEAKLHLVCKKLQLKPGEKVLELGCGWGGFARFAAKNYGVSVEAYNISTKQIEYCKEKNENLPIIYHLKDYREATGEFDKVVSIGMCEHVGPKNHRTLFELAHKCLKKHGIFLLHSIGNSKSVSSNDRWLAKYIFPGSVLPSPEQLGSAMNGLFVLEDWHNFGVDYDKTLMAWQENFRASWPSFKEKYGERFYRMWDYYLMCCAGIFRSRYCQLYQVVMSKNGVLGGWRL
ncbi:MAG: cyclopropane fatty acyl phospholipid synthase [Fibromonadaceae bacterium]|jgi:cyclopropane-fatty-acyl-phospholipid synthase|nr:cyclopropane fatty acyl phospholipid synthase [Fibromonadaceae bacterium]